MVAVTQHKLASIAQALEHVPEVIEVYGLSGVTDLLVRIGATDADDVYRIRRDGEDHNGAHDAPARPLPRAAADRRSNPIRRRSQQSRSLTASPNWTNWAMVSSASVAAWVMGCKTT
ncbi:MULTISPECIES: Lrp/AsnC ligand binding domain-containing protein [Mycobacterium avium complex (MAC)]|nr:Lrp/AsnC ligand binding domain-containing protein [Mycobacterium intracellulare]